MDKVRSVDSGFIRRATEVVVHHMDQAGFSGNELAESLHLSREQTHRKLKQYTSLSTVDILFHLKTGRFPSAHNALCGK